MIVREFYGKPPKGGGLRGHTLQEWENQFDKINKIRNMKIKNDNDENLTFEQMLEKDPDKLLKMLRNEWEGSRASFIAALAQQVAALKVSFVPEKDFTKESVFKSQEPEYADVSTTWNFKEWLKADPKGLLNMLKNDVGYYLQLAEDLLKSFSQPDMRMANSIMDYETMFVLYPGELKRIRNEEPQRFQTLQAAWEINNVKTYKESQKGRYPDEYDSGSRYPTFTEGKDKANDIFKDMDYEELSKNYPQELKRMKREEPDRFQKLLETHAGKLDKQLRAKGVIAKNAIL